MSAVRFTISMNDETTARLDEWAKRLNGSRSSVAEAAVAWYVWALENTPTFALVQSAPTVVQSAPTAGQSGPPVAQPQSAQSVTEQPPRNTDPLRGAKPGDTDAILVLIRELNAMPESRDLSGDMVWVNQTRRAELLRQIGALRTAVRSAEAT